MRQRILATSDGVHEAHSTVGEAAAPTRALDDRVRVVWTTGLPTISESREICSVDELREEVYHIANAPLVELQRQPGADGVPAETGVLMPDATDDDIDNALEHETEC